MNYEDLKNKLQNRSKEIFSLSEEIKNLEQILSPFKMVFFSKKIFFPSFAKAAAICWDEYGKDGKFRLILCYSSKDEVHKKPIGDLNLSQRSEIFEKYLSFFLNELYAHINLKLSHGEKSS